MPVPTITSVIANAGPTRGRRLVRIEGTNFRLRPPPAANGKTTGLLKDAVRVFFGGVEALDVAVLSPTAINATTPPHTAGPVSVVVQNVDQDGVLIGAEQVTLANAYTFVMPNFGATGYSESVLTRVVRAFIETLQTQLVANVALSVHTDSDDTPDGTYVATLAQTPGIALAGPFTRENKDHRSTARHVVQRGSSLVQERPPKFLDMTFEVTGVNKRAQPTLNFMQETINFFEEVKWLYVIQDPSVPGKYVRFEMDVEREFASAIGQDKAAEKEPGDNVNSFSGAIVIRAVPQLTDDMVQGEVFTVHEVIPTGSVMASAGVILVGQPGTYPAAPVQPNPPAEVGNTGPFEQLPIEDDNE